MKDEWITEEIERELKTNPESRNRFFLPLMIVVVLLVIIGGVAMYTFRNADDISAYADRPIVISGVQDEDFTVTPNDLLTLPCVEVSASGGTRKSAGVNGYGPEMDTFLAQYGRTIDEYKKIRFICTDDYTVVLKREYLTDGYQIVLAVRQIRRKLPRAQQPLRIIIPEGESGKWAYGIEEIDFVE